MTGSVVSKRAIKAALKSSQLGYRRPMLWLVAALLIFSEIGVAQMAASPSRNEIADLIRSALLPASRGISCVQSSKAARKRRASSLLFPS